MNNARFLQLGVRQIVKLVFILKRVISISSTDMLAAKKKKFRISFRSIALISFLTIMMACSEPGTSIEDILNESEPNIVSVFPADGESDIARDQVISVTFNVVMDPSTINDSTFSVSNGTSSVKGIIDYSEMTATFTPYNTFDAETDYTVSLAAGIRSRTGVAVATDQSWGFMTGGNTEPQPEVELGTARNYVILASTGIFNNPTSTITGDLGLSPADTSSLSGFDLTEESNYATSEQVNGRIYASNMGAPTPANLTAAVEDMITAFDDAAGRTTPDFIDLHNSDIGGRTLSPGLYKWNGSLDVSSDIAISGDSDDVWIFQIADDLNISSNVIMELSGNTQVRNIIWQVVGNVVVEPDAHLKGILLTLNNITLNRNAKVTGRMLTQESVNLDANTITQSR